MSYWKEIVAEDVKDWLLYNENPDIRYTALRELVGLAADDPNLLEARKKAHEQGKIPEILSHMHPDGYWVEPGPGYGGKYRSTVWSLITLAQLGASAKDDHRIGKACKYFLDAALTEHGQITAGGTPSTTADCLQGNMLAAMLDLGYQDSRIEKAFDYMARSVTGEGIAPMSEKNAPLRYYSGKIGPDFRCGANNKLSCAWGGVKVMLAFSKLPIDIRTPLIERAIQRGVKFFLSIEPSTAAYPCGYTEKPSGNWWKFGFPVFYVTDLLQLAEALVSLGFGNDLRMEKTIQLIEDKVDEQGRWALEYDYAGKTWCDFGKKKEPNPWVTLRVLKVLKAADASGSYQ